METLINLLKTDSNAANAFGALASAAAAFLALFLSAISVWISVWSTRAQRRHNELSVRPLAEVTLADYEDSLRVKLRNNGTGPMIVSSVTVTNGTSEKDCLIEWMPKLPGDRPWTTFTHTLRQRTLQVGAEIVLLELTQNEDDSRFSECRDIVRRHLAPLTVKVEYTDIYGSKLPPCQKALSWFGRHN